MKERVIVWIFSALPWIILFQILTRHLTGVLTGLDNFASPTVKYLRIDDTRCHPCGDLPRQSRSSSAAGVSRHGKPRRR